MEVYCENCRHAYVVVQSRRLPLCPGCRARDAVADHIVDEWLDNIQIQEDKEGKTDGYYS